MLKRTIIILKDVRALVLICYDLLAASTFLVENTSDDVALIRLDAIGDFILWLDTAKEYRRLYSNRKITLIANSVWAPVAEKLPYWDEIISVDIERSKRNLSYRWRLMRQIASRGFSVTIQPVYSRLFLLGDSLVRATRAPERIGSAGDLSNIRPWEKRVSDRWYNRLIPANPGPMMELERNAEFITGLCGERFTASMPILPSVAKLENGKVLTASYFIVFPGASWSGKQWPIQNYVELAKEIHAQEGWTICLCGGRADRSLCSEIARKLDIPLYNCTGETSLPEFVEIVRGAELLIGNDTSAVHIAAAVGTPSVCILGGGHFGRFMPYPDHVAGSKPAAVFEKMDCFGCNWKCTRVYRKDGPVPCIGAVSVHAVVEAASRARSRKNRVLHTAVS